MVPERSELGPIRAGEAFDAAAVEAWLRERVPGLEERMRVEQFLGGHANLTYLLRFGERELVLRRPPLGPVAPGAHDMGREWKVLSRLADHFPQAPRAHAFCDDPGVIGSPFIVMDRCRGVIIRDSVPPQVDRHPDGRRRATLALVDAMAAFHEVDWEKAGLADLGRPDGFLERQVAGWKDRWERAKEADVPAFDRVHEWLVHHRPCSGRATLVHNDLKLDNAMLDPDDPGRITALLDWDMTTLGDPLVDLGTLLGYWTEAGDPPERGSAFAVTAQPGFPTRAEIASRYAERRGVDAESIRWYEAFAHWKTTVVIQQIYIRYARGQTRDERFALLGSRVPVQAGFAAGVAGVR